MIDARSMTYAMKPAIREMKKMKEGLRWLAAVRTVTANFFFVIFAAFNLVATAVQADEAVWDRTPIRIELVVGAESRIDFPADVRIGLPTKLLDKDMLRQESLNGSVYFTAAKPFPTERVYASFVKTNKVILLDVSARAKRKSDLFDLSETATPRAPLKIVVADDPSNDTASSNPSARESDAATDQDKQEKQDTDKVDKNVLETAAITPITLSRYAAQQLYAPARLIPQNPNIQRVPMRAPKTLAPLYAGGEVRPEPIASWSGGGLFVTAVKLSNLTKVAVDLDPRKLRGRILHAAFQDKSLRLGPLGSATDTTTLYLITERPFAESVALNMLKG